MNRIHMAAHLDGDVELGTGNVIEAGAIIRGPVRIGDGNYFGPHCVVGTPAQDDFTRSELLVSAEDAVARETSVVIGDGNTFREFVTVHRGQLGSTNIGDANYVMAYTNIQHDCSIASGVKFANNVQMGGYTTIGRGSYLGLSAVIHQFTVVGAHCMVGMGSVVRMDKVPPGSLIHGTPARLRGPNIRALDALGVEETDWWPADVTDDVGKEMPSLLKDDLLRFRIDVERTACLRAEVDVFRAGKFQMMRSKEGFHA